MTDALYANSREHHPWKPHNTPSSGQFYSPTSPSLHPPLLTHLHPLFTASSPSPLPRWSQDALTRCDKDFSLRPGCPFLLPATLFACFEGFVENKERAKRIVRETEKALIERRRPSRLSSAYVANFLGSHRRGRRFFFSLSINWPNVYFISTVVSTVYLSSRRNCKIGWCARIILTSLTFKCKVRI